MSESSPRAGLRPVGGHRPHRSSDRSRRRLSTGLLVVLLAAFGSLIWAPAASAHDELLDLQPGNKVVLSTPPTEVQLVFGAAVLAMGTQVRVTGPKGTVVSTGPVSVNQGTVVQKLAGGLGDGVYRVDWRVTSSDGHPVSGAYTFTLKGAAPTATSTASAASATSASATATSTASATAAVPPSASSTTSASGGGTASSSGSGSSVGLAAGLLIAAAAVGGIAFALLRRAKGASTSNEGNLNS